jgi:transcriptional regulator with XRE-family HTH domain
LNDIFKYEKRKEEIGKRIKTLRKQKHLSQDDLANRLFYIAPTKDKALGQSTISSWERGVTLPPLERMIALASIFDCDVAYLLGDYSKEKKDNSDICDMTGLSEKAVSRLLLYKSQYSDNVDSLNFLLESDNLEDVLYHIWEYSNALRHAKLLRKCREKQIAAVSTSGEAYTPNSELLNAISAGTEKADLCEYNLSTRFGFIVQELKRKVEAEFNASKEGDNG